MNPDCSYTKTLEELFSTYMPPRIRTALKGIGMDRAGQMEEIRIRSGLPLMGVFAGFDRFIGQDGALYNQPDHSLVTSPSELRDLFYLLCEQSIYAYQEDIKRGFITLKGGHRAGLCGTVVYEGDHIHSMRDISSVSIRLSRQLKGCADEVFQSIIRSENDLYNTLILSPPRCGKTTLLRDLCRLISQGMPEGFSGLRTAVVDERSELAAVYRGIPQNDLGPRTDVLDGCRKSEGIEMMLRGMAPHVIIVDELGGVKDAEAVKMAWNAGVRLIATAHAYGLDDFRDRLGLGQLTTKEGFERMIILGMNNGKRWIRVMDSDGNESDCFIQGSGLSDGFRRVYGCGLEDVGKADREAAFASKAHGYTP